MKFEFNGRTYQIKWRYIFPTMKDGKTRKKNRPPHTTVCLLTTEDGKTVLTSTEIRLHSDSRPCYETARKFSMRKLLKVAADGPSMKEFRTSAWVSYFNRPRIANLAKIPAVI